MRLTEAGPSQKKLAVDADIDLTYLGGIERGRRNPSLLVMVCITAALEAEVTELLAYVADLRVVDDEPFDFAGDQSDSSCIESRPR